MRHVVFMCVCGQINKMSNMHVEAPTGVKLHNYRQALG